MLNEGRVGPGRYGDGGNAIARLGSLGESVISSIGGQHYEHLVRGNLFLYHVPAQALVIAGNGVPTLVNPFGSGKLFVPLLLRLGFVSGTAVIGSVLVAETLNVSAIATGAGSPVLTAILVASKNAMRGAGPGSLLWSPTTNTFTAAPTVIAASGINIAPADPVGGFVAESKFDGTLAFAPGTAMSVVYSVTSSVALFQATLVGLELPLAV